MVKRGGKRKKSTGPKKPTRAQYEAITVELNRKLALLRVEAQKADDINFELKEKTYGIESDHGQVSSHLGRIIADKDEIINEIEEKLIEMEKVQEEAEAELAIRIKELEAKYVNDEGQLASEIELFTLRTQSWEEYSRERKCLLEKFEELKFSAKNREQVFKENIYEMQQSCVVNKEQKKIEVNTALDHLTSDCLRSTQIRQAAFARRLLRENSDLRSLLQIHIKIVMKLIRKSEKSFEDHRNMVENYESLAQLKQHLEQVIARKESVIENVTDKYAKLQTQFVEMQRYAEIFGKFANEKDVLERFDWTATTNRFSRMCKLADLFKNMLGQMVAEHDEQELEIVKLTKLIQQIKIAVQLTVDSLKEIEQYQPRVAHNADQHDATLLKQNDLLAELIDILSNHNQIPETPSASSIHGRRSTYESGYVGIVPLQTRDSTKHYNCMINGGLRQEHNNTQLDSKLAKQDDACTLFDVEWGSDLYVSTDGDDTETNLVKDLILDDSTVA